jgi:hypothetical protein
MRNCTGFQRFRAGHASDSPWLSGFVNTITIGIPFFALVSLNGGIVMMLRHQNVQVGQCPIATGPCRMRFIPSNSRLYGVRECSAAVFYWAENSQFGEGRKIATDRENDGDHLFTRHPHLHAVDCTTRKSIAGGEHACCPRGSRKWGAWYDIQGTIKNKLKTGKCKSK